MKPRRGAKTNTPSAMPASAARPMPTRTKADDRPSCPAWLDKEAKVVWRYIVPQLEGLGLLSKADRNALTRYCQHYSRWMKAEMFLQQHGEIYPLKDEKGSVRCFLPWPQVSIAHKLGQSLTKLEQEFGLTPSARTRIEPCTRAPRHRSAPLSPEMEAFFRGGGPAQPRVPPPRPDGK